MLVRGRYHVTNPVWSLLGQPTNATQSDIAVRSNADISGINALTDGAAFVTGVATAVAIPVEYGDIITKISVFVGAAAEATGTHAVAGLYSGIGVPALLGQSTDLTGATAVGPVNARFDFTLAAAQLVTPVNAPNGYIYASVFVTATTQPTVGSYTVAAAVGYQWFTNAPLKMGGFTHGSALTTVLPATIVSPTGQAVTPVYVLS